MLSSLGCLLLCGSIALALGNAQKLPKGKKPSLKVHINTTSDSVLLKFLRPNPNVKLEGFLLGYGSNVSPNQYFPLPTEGKFTEAVVDAEPKYLIVVRPAPPPSQKKSCSGKSRTRKPLQLVVGTLTPSSVFLSWGFLINPHHDWTLPSHCSSDRFYTIRYREKDKEKKWIFQLCPATETIVENLKPNTVYEFGVKDNIEGGIWSKIFNHKTIVGSKNKVNGKIQSTYDQVHSVPAYVPRKLIPITIIKQVIQNVTHRASTKSPDKIPFGGTILVHLIIPGLNDSTVKLPSSIMLEISDALKAQLAKNETLALPAESKTPEVEKVAGQPVTAPQQTTSIPSTPKRQSTPKPPRVKPAPEPETRPSAQSTKAPPHKTKKPGRRRPKTTRSPEVPKSKPALEPATVPPEILVPTIVPKPPQRPKATRRPEAPQIQPAHEPVTFGSEAPALAIVTTTDIAPVISRTKASVTTLAPKSSRPRTRQRPKYKATPSPKIPQTKPADLGPITAEPSLASTTKKVRRPRPKPKTTPHPEVPQTILVPATSLEPVIRTETPGTTLVPKLSQQPDFPHPKPKTTRSPAAPPTELVSTTVFEPVIPLKEDPVTTIVPFTDLEPATDLETPVAFRTEAPRTTLASKKSQRTRRPRPRPPKATLSPQAPKTKTVPAVVLEPVTLRPEVQVTTLAPKKTQIKHRPRPKPKPIPSPEVAESKPVPTKEREPVTLRTESWVTTKAPKTPKRTHRVRPKPKTTTPEAPLTKPVAATDLESSALSTEVPTTVVLTTALVPATLRTKSPKTTLAPSVQRTRRPRPRPKTTARTDVSESKSVSDDLELVAFSTESPQKTIAPRQTTSPPPKLKPPHSRRPAKEQVPKGSLHTTSKPKMPPSPEVVDITSVPKDEQLSHKPDPEVSQSETVLPPVTFRVEPPKTTIVPLETRDIPLIPVISPRPSEEELQTTMEQTDQSTQELFTTKIPRTTELAKTTQAPHRLHTTPVRPRIPERPHGRPALNKTTTRPDRTKSRGMSHKNGVGPGTKQTPKPSSTGRNTSVDSHATRKPGLIPGTRHRHTSPRPVPPQRKPLPPNNVTGKPGSAGIISSSRATSPPLKATLKPTGTATERPGAEKKQPTAPASEEEFGNTTDFSSSPTKETDPLGKPRFIGPHVRYIPKPDNKPCSITDSVRRFPTEEATEGNATSPPQNPPTNLTVVTVEGCPSFVILDWEKPLNDTVTEYEVISRENGSFSGKNKSIQITNQTFSTVENLKPDTSYEFQVKPKNPLGEGPASNTVAFSTESADPRVSEPISAGRDAIWTERPFNSDSYSECKGKQYVKRTWYKKFVGVQLCNSLRYKIYLSDSLTGKFYNIGDQRGHGEDHCQFVDSFLDGRTGQQLTSDQLPTKEGYFRAVRQEPVQFGEIGGHTQINYVQWYECGTTIPGKW
ncbi:target of Nesh-SH3 isoform X28 [Rattus norvegicus]|uniref:target of Nesh-SH3 isoform X28 n=1 Tax=Rattus norvegicus TaxID=10116 RepID=UPI0003D0C454|nr:target of Nesh-SH3 isoform X19 [Rattus norvegicus]|eukprot:XP_017453625.1 PREDICTED: target of Nesh-SH3 isoform X18 [Rattus norvegicus]